MWYAFTPSVSGSYSAAAPNTGFSSQVAAYRGDALGSLSEVGCRAFGQPLTFHADAGTTYYFQLGELFGGRGTLSLDLDVAPPPVASLYYYPGDPSTFDTVQFYDLSWDPAQVGIEPRTWDFGDGGASTEPYPRHRYTSDGSYEVRLTVTTFDGRSASAAWTVAVMTHDVAIAKVTVPQAASAGQTRQITVGLTNTHYPEAVQLQLLKSVAGGGWQQVGVLTQSVPVRSANRTTSFAFSYTFTEDDAALGKVTFQAIATIQGARDAIPADNTVISLPTKVNA